jgi:hypothetical protein
MADDQRVSGISSPLPGGGIGIISPSSSSSTSSGLSLRIASKPTKKPVLGSGPVSSETYFKSSMEVLSKENKQLKTKLDQLERENRDLKKSIYDLSVR